MNEYPMDVFDDRLVRLMTAYGDRAVTRFDPAAIAHDAVVHRRVRRLRLAFVSRPRARLAIAAVILAAWAVGLTLLIQREFFRGRAETLAEAALRISPGATYYVVEQDGRQIGFSSTTIDTTATGIEVTDYFIADLPVGGVGQRASARSVITLTRALALRTFDVEVEAAQTPMHVRGRTEGDTAVVFQLSAPGQPADTQRVAVRGPILLPTLVPLAVALGETPKVGKTVVVPTFDPQTLQPRDLRLAVRAESLFTLDDSAAFDPGTRRWRSALRDTVRAWRVEAEGGTYAAWVDGGGKVVETTQMLGLKVRRTAYELAFENWRLTRDSAQALAAAADGDVLERSAIAAGIDVGAGTLRELRVRLSGVDLRGYDLAGGRQSLAGDALTVRREDATALTPSWSLLGDRDPAFQKRFAAELASEPLLQANAIEMVTQAVRIAGPDRDPRVLAEKLNRWVHDNLKKEVTFSVPNALAILQTRRGDCNEHTQLYTALARSLGIPTRIATGLAYVRGKFYYHAWPEVWLGDWVAVDPTFGQFPADAAHLRFITGGLVRQAELLRLVGTLKVDVLERR